MRHEGKFGRTEEYRQYGTVYTFISLILFYCFTDLMAPPTRASYTQTHPFPRSPLYLLYRISSPTAVRLLLIATSRSSPGPSWLPRASCLSSLREGSGHVSYPPPDARPTALTNHRVRRRASPACCSSVGPRHTSLLRHAHASSGRLLPAPQLVPLQGRPLPRLPTSISPRRLRTSPAGTLSRYVSREGPCYASLHRYAHTASDRLLPAYPVIAPTSPPIISY